jgi:CDP-diacylglycerol--serine O-phosphatidyltransferase
MNIKKHIPNFLTCLNLIVGVLGCIAIVKGDLWNAIYFVILAGIFDFLDGFVARILNVKSDIGKELDSLADMISFGLLPALYMQGAISQTALSPLTLSYIGILIAPFSAIRLAKFNLDSRQTEQFIGLPTPANAIFITSLTFLPFQMTGWALVVLSLVSCFLLVSNFPMLALKFSSFDLRSNYMKYLLIIISVLCIMIFGFVGVVYVVPAYIILSIVGNYASKNSVETGL